MTTSRRVTGIFTAQAPEQPPHPPSQLFDWREIRPLSKKLRGASGRIGREAIARFDFIALVEPIVAETIQANVFIPENDITLDDHCFLA